MYLFATEWLPAADGDWEVEVPGGARSALDTAGNLLQVALWHMRRDGVIALEQVRPVDPEWTVTLGGESFVRFTVLTPNAERAGLEGAVLRAARKDKDEDALRRIVLALDLHDRAPWTTVTAHCFAELDELIEERGRLVKKIEIVDAEGVEKLRPEFAQIRAERRADMDQAPELYDAVIADCIAAVNWAHSA